MHWLRIYQSTLTIAIDSFTQLGSRYLLGNWFYINENKTIFLKRCLKNNPIWLRTWPLMTLDDPWWCLMTLYDTWWCLMKLMKINLSVLYWGIFGWWHFNIYWLQAIRKILLLLMHIRILALNTLKCEMNPLHFLHFTIYFVVQKIK